MLPFYKLFSLVIRVFSRPLINYTKKIHMNADPNSQQRLRKFFIWFGNFYHRMEAKINRRFLKIGTDIAHKPLNDQLAVEKGIEFSYQIIFYAIVIGLPIYQLVRGQNDAKQKSDKLERRLKSIEDKIQILITQKQNHNKINIKNGQFFQKEQDKEKISISGELSLNNQQQQIITIQKQRFSRNNNSNKIVINWNNLLILNTLVQYLKYDKISQKILETKFMQQQQPKIINFSANWIPFQIWSLNFFKKKINLVQFY